MTFTEMDSIFNKTKNSLVEFMGILTPIIENAKGDHERLFWHHIYEEEEHRSDRLDILMPKIQVLITNGTDIPSNQLEFVHLLQDISLEKFGLHNFLEHLDLFLYQFKEPELVGKIQPLRDFTYEDYQQMKVILEKLNQEFQGGIELNTSIPTDEKEENGSNVKIDTYTHDHAHEPPQTKQSMRKTLTVGSLKQR
jgi:hypothetical protein